MHRAGEIKESHKYVHEENDVIVIFQHELVLL